MAIGNQANLTPVMLNNYAAQTAVQLRSVAAQILALQASVVSLGQAGLVALGYSAGDATTLLTVINEMATVAQVYQGTATQASLFNFQNALVALTGIY